MFELRLCTRSGCGGGIAFLRFITGILLVAAQYLFTIDYDFSLSAAAGWRFDWLLMSKILLLLETASSERCWL